jgi:hypothetical protein
MINSIFKGFNIFKKKIGFFYSFLAYLALTLYTYLIFYNITEWLEIDTTNINLLYIPEFLIYNLGWKLLLALFIIFGLLFLTIYLTFIISQTENSRKYSFKKGIIKSLRYSILVFLVFLSLSLLFFVLINFISSILITILMIILVIVIIYLTILFFIGNIYIGLLNKTITESLELSRKIIKRKFWTIIGFTILIYIIYFILYFIIDLIYFELFENNYIVAIIFNEIFLLFIMLYIINAFTIFIKNIK